MAKHVFLTFDYDDLELVNLFRGQAKNQNNDLTFDDYSVKEAFDSENAAYVRGKIKELMAYSSIVLCVIGKSTASSRWVKWEIETADALGKRLGGVRLHSSTADVAPQALIDRKATLMDWDIDAIVRWIGA